MDQSKEFQKILDAYVNCRPYNEKMVTEKDLELFESLTKQGDMEGK